MILGIVVVLIILFFVFASLATDFLWYQQLGFTRVIMTQWIAGTSLFFIGFLGMAVPVYVSIDLAYRFRPVYAKLNSQLDRYQQVIEPLRRTATIGIPSVLGLFGAIAASTHWQMVLEWLNRTPFHKTDPQFHLDIGFYVFSLPFYQSIVGFASAVVLLSALAALATSYLYGALRFSGREIRITRVARLQIAITAAVYLALQAISLWLDQYATLTDGANKLIVGATYTDVVAGIPAKQILAYAAAVVAILFIVTAVVGRWRLPLIGTALLILISLLIGAVYPWGVQTFKVNPSVASVESSYIQRNINATRDAYDVSKVKTETYSAKSTATSGALASDAVTTENIRIIDPSLVTDAFSQLQKYKQYYGFSSQLDVDRYKIDGKVQDVVIAVRELNQSGLGSGNTEFNSTFVYTHGYGVVAAYGNQRSADGQPVFLESGIPVSGALGTSKTFQPRIYFGENSPAYSIVGGNGLNNVELDYPSGNDNNGNGNATTTYSGNGGPKLDNAFTKLIYAMKFQSSQILLSSSVNSKSQILYDRDPSLRVKKVAPYLTIDSNPYPAIVDGHVVWMIEGYTTTSQYPYSAERSLSQSIADTYTPAPTYATDQINYIRNSVKATVDAYTGKVTLYAWDKSDPILQTWEKIFPATVKPMSDMSATLLSHVRYPEDMFKVQREILGTYHVTDAGSFYSGDDAWTTPNEPTKAAGDTDLQPPYYLTMKLPNQDPAYQLYSTFIPQQTGQANASSVLTGYLAANSDAGDTKGTISSSYGQLTLLTTPKTDNIPGPGQVQANFNSDTTVASELALLSKGDTSIERGNLLTLPVGGGFLYVQPVYVKSNSDTSYPILQRVLVSFGNQIAFESTLQAALDDVFGGNSGASTGDANLNGGSGSSGSGSSGSTGSGSTGSGSTGSGSTGSGSTGTGSTATGAAASAAVKAALAQAETALTNRAAALKSGDLVAAAQADEALQKALDAASKAAQ